MRNVQECETLNTGRLQEVWGPPLMASDEHFMKNNVEQDTDHVTMQSAVDALRLRCYRALCFCCFYITKLPTRSVVTTILLVGHYIILGCPFDGRKRGWQGIKMISHQEQRRSNSPELVGTYPAFILVDIISVSPEILLDVRNSVKDERESTE